MKVSQFTVHYNAVFYLIPVYADKADGKIQFCEGQDGTITINLNGSTNTSSSLACCELSGVYRAFTRISIAGQFKMYKVLMDADDIAHSYDVICLENCAHPGCYISWIQQDNKYKVTIHVRQRKNLCNYIYFQLLSI